MYLDRGGLSEVGPPDALEQRVVETEVAETRHGPRGHRARHVDPELVLQVYHLDQGDWKRGLKTNDLALILTVQFIARAEIAKDQGSRMK